MKKYVLKTIVMIAQSSLIIAVVGYAITQSQLVAIPPMLAIAVLIFCRCAHCKLSFSDDRINQKLFVLKFYDTSIVDRCPVCGHSMV